MIEFKLNDKRVQGEEGEYILQVARKYGVEIPTLCHHQALEPAGMCRLCTVELFDGRRSRFVTACNYPIWDGMAVQTDSDAVHQGRKLIVELLLTRCPNVPIINDLASKYGISKPRFKLEENDCILCGLCTRVCEKMGANAIQLAGRGMDLKIDTPFHVQTDACIGCGACAFVCPTGHIKPEDIDAWISKQPLKEIPSEYEQGLAHRKPIYVPYAQAIPNIPAIDRERCVHFKSGGCRICTEFCAVSAIDHSQQDEIVELDVGSIIMASGFEPYDPAVYDTYGYTRHPNIVTSLEFERMLSASGPTQGHVLRPSDKKPPAKIAWLQCVGSRDVHAGARKYCSSVCCTYAVKEAVMAKDHVPGLDAAIFYIDMRTHGKDFENYFNAARDRSGVRFVKSRISTLTPENNSELINLAYIDESGLRKIEPFDIVVLSVGMCISKDTSDLARLLQVNVDDDGFPVTDSFNPVQTSRAGVLVCGASQAPQDIPSSVIGASATAAEAARSLQKARWSSSKTRELPLETDLRGTAPRIGVFVCNCGTNIAGVVKIASVVEYARSLPYVVYVTDQLFACSQDAQELLGQAIKTHHLNRVVIAACTPRTHEPIFRETAVNAGLNKYLIDMANIRNHCSWVHADVPESATEKSKDLVRLSVAKVAQLVPLTEQEITINQEALIIGGGVAGMTAARDLARQGFATHLVEKTNALGGQATRLLSTWKGEDVSQYLDRLIQEVKSEESLNIYLQSEVLQVEGSIGRFKTSIHTEGETKLIEHGAAIIATGASELKPAEYLYGQNAGVMTGLEFDRKLRTADAQIAQARTAVFVQCVGSRIPERPYCSKVCCTHSVRGAMELLERNPDMEVFILYRDIRTYGLRENLYRQARDRGIHFIRFDLQKGLTAGENQGNIEIIFTDAVLNQKLTLHPDLLILASAIVSPQESELSKKFKVPLNQDGFFVEAHVKLRPVDFATDGVFVCGLAHGPKPIDESIIQAQAAVARAAAILCKSKLKVGGLVAETDAFKCTGCRVCAEVCPYQAVEISPDDKAVVNEAVCKGCGLCAASCRSGAASLKGFSDADILAQLEAFTS